MYNNALRNGTFITPDVTDPGLLAMANSAASQIASKPVAATIGVSFGNTATQIVQALQKWMSSQGASIPTDGTITYFTLAVLITLAYGT